MTRLEGCSRGLRPTPYERLRSVRFLPADPGQAARIEEEINSDCPADDSYTDLARE